MFKVTKTYGHELGLSTCFRQPGAASHCKDPHGYPLSFKLTFAAKLLDRNNWVLDFGGLKPIKAWLAETFDHRTHLAATDPHLEKFEKLYEECGFKPIVVLPFVGCEGFARFVFTHTNDWLQTYYRASIEERGLRLLSVEVREHAGNSAIYEA